MIANQSVYQRICEPLLVDNELVHTYETFVKAVSEACALFAYDQELLCEKGDRGANAGVYLADWAHNKVHTVFYKHNPTPYDFKVMSLSIVEQLAQVTGFKRSPMTALNAQDTYGYDLFGEIKSPEYQQQYDYLLYSYSTPIYDQCLDIHEIQSYFQAHGYAIKHINPTETCSGGLEYTADIYHGGGNWKFVPWHEINTAWKLAAWLDY